MDDSRHAGFVITLRRRLPWMVINLATAFAAAATVGIFKSTIARLAMRLDPALGSGVVVTTFTDVIGFLSFLGLATLTLR